MSLRQELERNGFVIVPFPSKRGFFNDLGGRIIGRTMADKIERRLQASP